MSFFCARTADTGIQNIDEEKKDVQVVIVSPTRELATQLYKVCIELTQFSEKEIEVAKVIGGMDREVEIKKYEKKHKDTIHNQSVP